MKNFISHNEIREIIMKKLFLISFIIYLILLLLTCKKESPIEPPTPTTGSIYGIVIDMKTQLPVADAVVVATKSQISDTTDSLGNFILKEISIGTETLQVIAEGYETQNKVVEVKPDSQWIDITLNWAQGTWTHLGLENKFIQRLRLFKPYLYACTSSDGLFRKDIQSVSSNWQYMGFPGNVSDVLVNPQNPEEILVASQPDSATDHGVYKSIDGGNSWFVSDSGLGYSLPPPYNDTIYYAHPSTFCMTPYDLFAAGGYLVHSSSFGDIWHKISGIAGDINDFRYHNLYDSYLWIGSRNLFGGPVVYFSKDSGNTWDYDLLESLVTGDDAIFSIAFNPNDPEVVYASMFKRIIKTTDGGSSWFVIMSYSGPGYIFSIVEDDSQSNRLFAAAGFTALETRDGGNNWFDLDSPNGSGIVTMLYDSEDRVLYIGTGDGPNPPNGVFVYKKTN